MIETKLVSILPGESSDLKECHLGSSNFPENNGQCFAWKEKHSSAYINDILIFSMRWEDHLIHIQAVLVDLRIYGFSAKPQKCVCGELGSWNILVMWWVMEKLLCLRQDSNQELQKTSIKKRFEHSWVQYHTTKDLSPTMLITRGT